MSTGLLRTYAAALIVQSGRMGRPTIGGLDDPLGEVEIDMKAVTQGTFEVATENTFSMFNTDGAARFQFLAFRIIGEGTLWAAYKTDKPTSSSNFAPSGLAARWRHFQWTCKMGVFCFNTDLTIGHATAASETASDGSLPALWTTYIEAVDTHKIYSFALRNPSDTDPVEIEYLVVRQE